MVPSLDLTTDDLRRDRTVKAMRDAGIDALVCALPRNVLLLSGYWPVLGDSVAIVHGEELVLVGTRDEVEREAAERPDRVLLFSPATLTALRSPQDALQ